MEQRIAFTDGNKGLMDGLFKIGMYLKQSGLDHKLMELIKTRASQINGCAYCLDMHWKDAIALGETEQRLYSLSAWRETPYYTAAERAALAYTEEVTKIPQTDVSDEVFNELSKHFDKAQIADLTMAVISINSWNRINVAFRTIPGGYKPGMFN
ncbi:carboxymuconolactone decarboxylase [Niastella yeongjuensis]|uniref:Carboxymuconolactone decarboxylase n=1 Tax=Niastella yeongjuensis TaxID=354355 RepID=A0A1V9EJ57_9BACT|nr:carboxymuconolactone decarboxylase family protein [Niastella yeongjuensis]OQP46160.1 carboxymuconolactone decarboxylase [Niastella yeongjuensis]SEP18353.1 alkylhydroperoxidase AhpD family core domain-containing protein [Niastella yeongjuensis]